MEISQENDELQDNPAEPVIENEATKNSEKVNADKANKSPSADENLPGYPHYPSGEDIFGPSNPTERVDEDVEYVTRAGNLSATDIETETSTAPSNDMQLPIADDSEDELGIVPGTEADVTKEDLMLLGPKDQDMDMGEDEELENSDFPLDVTGEDLDIPGDELDNANEDIGEEDEENNYYSLGGDSKD